MSSDVVIMLASRLVVAGVAAFLAIVLWSMTRDTAWMFIVIGTIVGYGEVVLSTLESLGVVRIDALMVGGVSLFRVLFAVLPMLFFIIAFAILIVRKRIR
ncbi:MAG: hypothetical protein EA404_00370 [Spirochaetaceae bacterium]|nr:MAG: hypothetical protein EA404_00370 [Spirochaetaceae bacterium]